MFWRFIYSLAWLAVLPAAFLYLLKRSRLQPEYRHHWRERLGWAPRQRAPLIWIHAVSVGETRAAAPLVTALLARDPACHLLLTHATPTGRATGRELFSAQFGARVAQAYLPYDFPLLTALFLWRTRPLLGLIMETELWPNLLHACRVRHIPVLLMNARLSSQSARKYQRVAPLVRSTLADLAGVAAQTHEDAARLSALGARHVEVTGNIKFDVSPPADTESRVADLRQRFAGRFVFLCASTREGEETVLLDALSGLQLPGLLLVLVPRHPQRFNAVADLLRERGLSFVRRSEGGAVTADTAVFLGDSMGEMAAYYRAADACYVGGSLLPMGGQNMIEAAAAGCPALIGPHTWNFDEAAIEAVACGAAWRVADAVGLARGVEALYRQDETRTTMHRAGIDFASRNQGASARMLALALSTLTQTQ